jgi:hypothetical protein
VRGQGQENQKLMNTAGIKDRIGSVGNQVRVRSRGLSARAAFLLICADAYVVCAYYT